MFVPLSLIAGMMGMNVKVPFQMVDNYNAFIGKRAKNRFFDCCSGLLLDDIRCGFNFQSVQVLEMAVK
jgi:hypothetical protein